MNSRVQKIVLSLLAICFLAGAFVAQRSLNADKAALGLTRVEPLRNAPPVLAFTTVALGGFRGLIANALWIRASELQDEDKVFEMVQLSEWITAMEPHYVQVWAVQAWNMAYNISVKFKDAPDRWRWVRKGIELIRDRGLVYNPGEPLLYRELAWFFQHKMGQHLDDAHMYYKQAWFEEMNAVLGEKPNFGALINPATDEQRQKARALRETYKMDPAVMKQVDETYGPLEWRLPETHAIYWAWVGMKNAKSDDLMPLRRLIYQSMQLEFNRGAIIPDRIGGGFNLGPNLDMMDNANKAYEDMMKQDPEEAPKITTGHKNFLMNGVFYLYTFNRQREAAQWFAHLKRRYPEAVAQNLTLDQYAVQRVTEAAGETNPDQARAVIAGLIVNSFMELAQDEDDRAANFDRLAQRVWARYQSKIRGQEGRIGLPPLSEMKQQVLRELLDPAQGLPPEAAARLRTKLGLPAASPPATPTP